MDKRLKLLQIASKFYNLDGADPFYSKCLETETTMIQEFLKKDDY